MKYLILLILILSISAFSQTTVITPFLYVFGQTTADSISARMMTVNTSGTINSILYSNYLNFGTTFGTSGYGFRDNSGTMQVKNSAGSWLNIAGASGSAGGWTQNTGYVALTTSTDKVQVGPTVQTEYKLFVNSETINTILGMSVFNSTAANGNVIYANRHGGTAASPTAVTDGYLIMSLAGRARDSDALEDGCSIKYIVDGEVNTAGDGTDMPTRMEFYTSPDGSDAEALRMRIKNDGRTLISTDASADTTYGALTLFGYGNTNSQLTLSSQVGNAISTDELIGGIDFVSRDNDLTNKKALSARIKVQASASHSSTSTPGGLFFMTTPTNSKIPKPYMKLAQNGDLLITGEATPAGTDSCVTIGRSTGNSYIKILDRVGDYAYYNVESNIATIEMSTDYLRFRVNAADICYIYRGGSNYWIYPNTDNTVTLGRPTLKWKAIYGYDAWLQGTVTIGDSTTGDHDAIIYAADDGDLTAHNLKWDDGNGRWEASDKFYSPLLQVGSSPGIDSTINIDGGIDLSGGIKAVATTIDSLQIGSGVWIRKNFVTSVSGDSIGTIYYNTVRARIDTVWMTQ